MQKTNAIRLLENAHIDFTHHSFPAKDFTNGVDAAKILAKDPNNVFKTLVTIGRSGENYVFVIPVNMELDLKKSAKAVGEKSIQLIKSKELLPLTGYIHGGCSPLCLKKELPVIFDENVILCEEFIINAGAIGVFIEISHDSLTKILKYQIADLC